MKTRNLKQIAKLFVIVSIAIFSGNRVMAQFDGTSQVDQTPIEERKENTSTYTVGGPATDRYTWEVIGGTVVVPATGVTGLGTVASPYVVPLTVGLQSIQVEWPVDDSTITSTSGNVSVQREVASGTVECPSIIQSLEVVLWSNPTITILDEDYAICSGDATAGPITVELTGAPNFDFRYTITDLEGNVSVVQEVLDVTTGTATIPIPANLVNTSDPAADQTYVITITEMFDAFDDGGTIVDGTFTITVHPTIETGPITSDSSLTRR